MGMTPYGHRQVGSIGPAQIKLNPASEADSAIVVSGQIIDMIGEAFAGKRDVLVEVFAVTGGKGGITVVSGGGTEKVAVSDATGKIQRSWLETTAAGAFAVSIATDAGKSILIAVRANGCLDASAVLTFAAG